MYFVKGSISCFRHDEKLMELTKLLNIFIPKLDLSVLQYSESTTKDLLAFHTDNRILWEGKNIWLEILITFFRNIL